jgi:hypothetical protein
MILPFCSFQNVFNANVFVRPPDESPSVSDTYIIVPDFGFVKWFFPIFPRISRKMLNYSYQILSTIRTLQVLPSIDVIGNLIILHPLSADYVFSLLDVANFFDTIRNVVLLQVAFDVPLLTPITGFKNKFVLLTTLFFAVLLYSPVLPVFGFAVIDITPIANVLQVVSPTRTTVLTVLCLTKFVCDLRASTMLVRFSLSHGFLLC